MKKPYTASWIKKLPRGLEPLISGSTYMHLPCHYLL